MSDNEYNIPLDLKYRPRKFEQILGNTATKNLISSMITNGEFPRFSIFSGPPGCGKTTTAFLVAMALQCETYNGKGICGYCDSCKALEDVLYKEGRGNSVLGVTTFDMGLNTDEEYLNNIAHSIKSGSFMGKKIMIIEELQRTRKDAQESLLNTLEFIPDDVYIIVTTSELTKIITALRTRAVDFRFNYPTSIELKEYLKTIAQKEKIKIDVATITQINQVNNNNPRKALKTLDTVKSSGLDAIEYIKELKSFDYDLYIEFFEKVSTSMLDTILFIEELDSKTKFLQDMKSYIKDNIVIRLSPRTIPIKADKRNKILQSLANYSDDLLMRIMDDIIKIGYIREEDAGIKLLTIAQKLNKSLYLFSNKSDDLTPASEQLSKLEPEIEEITDLIKNTRNTLSINDL